MLDRLLLATNNQGKARELKSLLRDIPFEIVTPSEIGIDAEVKENVNSFEENAGLKASALAKQSGLLTLADDSGLEVDALGGEPGVLSHRYAGEGATDEDRVRYLLTKLEGVPQEKRTARFCCSIAVATPEGEVELFSGECQGFITFEPKGTLGFGYDPIFYFPELGKTMAELPLAEKNQVSHRGKAASKAIELLKRLAR